MMVVYLVLSDDCFDVIYICNYVVLYICDELVCIFGVGEVGLFGFGDYVMWLWVNL